MLTQRSFSGDKALLPLHCPELLVNNVTLERRLLIFCKLLFSHDSAGGALSRIEAFA